MKSLKPVTVSAGKPSARNDERAEKKVELESVKKKVKTKTPIEIDIFEALLKNKVIIRFKESKIWTRTKYFNKYFFLRLFRLVFKSNLFIFFFQESKVKKDKGKAVLGGKIKKDERMERVVRNKLDSSAPTKKRGKEREGGKKKKKTLMKKIILSEKEERRRGRAEAEVRRLERIQVLNTLLIYQNSFIF